MTKKLKCGESRNLTLLESELTGYPQNVIVKRTMMGTITFWISSATWGLREYANKKDNLMASVKLENYWRD